MTPADMLAAALEQAGHEDIVRVGQVGTMGERIVLAHDHEQGAFMFQSGGETWRAVSSAQDVVHE